MTSDSGQVYLSCIQNVVTLTIKIEAYFMKFNITQHITRTIKVS